MFDLNRFERKSRHDGEQPTVGAQKAAIRPGDEHAADQEQAPQHEHVESGPQSENVSWQHESGIIRIF